MQIKQKILYPPLLKGITEILRDVFLNLRPSDLALDNAFKQNKKWGSRDRRSIAELVYFILRNFSKIVSNNEMQDFSKINLEELVQKSAQLEGYALTHLSPEEENQLQIKIKAREFPLPSYFLKLNEDPEKIIYPQWQQAQIYLRLNPSQTSKKKVFEILQKNNLAFQDIKVLPYGFSVNRKEIKNVLNILTGLCEVQDGASQLLCQELPLTPSSLVIDTCAGAGGKSLYLANFLDKANPIKVHDLSSSKLRQLEKRFHNNHFNYQILKETELLSYHQKANLVLIDTPCSGLGVLKRKPETLWQLGQEKITELVITQQKILQNYSKLVAPQGYLAYMTCSVLKIENECQIQKFLENNQDFKTMKEIKSYGHENPEVNLQNFEGMYLWLGQRA